MSTEFDFRPDWTAVLTLEEMQRELHGFRFKGPGWYFSKAPISTVLENGQNRDAMLICAYDDARYFVQVWNHWDGFKNVLNAAKAAIHADQNSISEMIDILEGKRDDTSRNDQLIRNGRWGTCAECPTTNHKKYPENCKNYGRYDHNIEIKPQTQKMLRIFMRRD